jgi:hypothetical protein
LKLWADSWLGVIFVKKYIPLIHRYFLLLVFLTAGCAVSPRFQGEYCGKPGFINSSLKLYNDSTYIYKWRSCVSSTESRGKWKIKGKYLVLNSYKQPGNPFDIKKSTDTTDKLISVLVKDTDNESIVGAFVKFITEEEPVLTKTGSDGIATCRACYNNLKEIKIDYISYERTDIVLNNDERVFNKFEVTLSPSYSVVHFTNEKFELYPYKIMDPKTKYTWRYYIVR